MIRIPARILHKIKPGGSHAIRGLVLLLGCLLWTNTALAADSFIITDIRVEGLQRISEGTVYNYLPLDAGDRLTAANTRSAIREAVKAISWSSRSGNVLRSPT